MLKLVNSNFQFYIFYLKNFDISKTNGEENQVYGAKIFYYLSSQKMAYTSQKMSYTSQKMAYTSQKMAYTSQKRLIPLCCIFKKVEYIRLLRNFG